jgi:hypothetical protein
MESQTGSSDNGRVSMLLVRLGRFLADLVIGVRIARFLATELPRLFNVEETNVALPDAI